ANHDNVYEVTVQASDGHGGSDSQALAVTVTDANDAPAAVALTDVTTPLAGKTATSTPLKEAEIVGNDDGLGTNQLVLSGADAAKFEIVGTALYLKDGVVLDHATQPNLSVTVSASDPTVAGSTPVSTAYTLAVTQTGPVAGNLQVIGEDTIL